MSFEKQRFDGAETKIVWPCMNFAFDVELNKAGAVYDNLEVMSFF